MKGLIIDEPWLGKILRGEKVWEMRTTATGIRGRIALIRKGSGRIVGTANLIDSIGPLDMIACRAHRDKHGILSDQDEVLLRWNHAWVLEGARPLLRDVSYQHPNGAVIWVNLEEAAVDGMVTDHGTSCLAGLPHPVVRPASLPRKDDRGASTITSGSESMEAGGFPSLIPVAKCGSWFGPHLARRGGFTIGAKGEELAYADYDEALAALRGMTVARWRRPNANGNWGIVAGVRWCRPDELPPL